MQIQLVGDLDGTNFMVGRCAASAGAASRSRNDSEDDVLSSERSTAKPSRILAAPFASSPAPGGMPELIKAFGLTMAKGRTNRVERWLQAGVPRYRHVTKFEANLTSNKT